jgi:hypothetical protein
MAKQLPEWRVVETIIYRVRARNAELACDVIVQADDPDDYYWLCDGRTAGPWPEESKAPRSFVR